MSGDRPDGRSETRTVLIRVIPRARRNEIDGERAGRLLVRTTAVPTDGRANEAVRKLLARHYGVPVSAVELVAGERSRDKTVRVHPRRTRH